MSTHFTAALHSIRPSHPHLCICIYWNKIEDSGTGDLHGPRQLSHPPVHSFDTSYLLVDIFVIN